ncbi:MAG TPA: asparagine synthase (glutamine-hydrolyzing) [Candidatus Eisenbacteria bacterium]|nr:asparagine synthase (glutamine-hydrolyzing) [Candidatus Eisenbacteria bacterium]
MCGICGIFAPGAGAVDRAVLERMTSSIVHRGPDDVGVHVKGPIGLGFRRLSIIGIETGHQPMFTEDGRLAIIFNGEIYNYRELRRELEARGHRFRTETDTETILLAYRQWGPDSVRRLRGMFGYAIWDETQRALFLARDRLGIKPLYYAWDGSTLRFGSEIKAILEDRSFRPTLDPLALDEYLTYLYVPAPRSIFREVRKLRPGHTLTATARGIEEREYWDLAIRPGPERSEEEVVEGLRDALRDSVACHLMSEVPLGAFLSGGIDSSAVVAVMAELDDRPVRTESIGFREDAYDELPFARQVARAFGTDAHEKVVEAHAADILDALAWHYDEPFADSSMVPTWYVSKAARERVTVCLSGDGGDENFAGYRRMRFDYLENRIRSRIPRWVRRGVLAPVAAAYPKADRLPQVFRGKTLLTNLTLSPERAYHNTMRWFTPAMKARLYRPALRAQVGDHDAFGVQEEFFRRSEGWHPLSRIQYVDFKTYLPDDILAKVDRASMAHSLEVRVPLLDHRFVEHVAAIPADLKIRNGSGKYVFKRALEGLVPPDVLTRPKMGFSVPLDLWFRGELRAPFEERVLAPGSFTESLFEPGAMRSLWDEHQKGTRDRSYPLWALLTLEHWGRRFAPAAA